MNGFEFVYNNKSVATIIGFVAVAAKESSPFTKIAGGLLGAGLVWVALSQLAKFIRWVWIERGLRELARNII